ncbi:hypothetical protein R75461_07209 [Paraburkholderia nemoris]|uniref:heparin lyase I family protein n=1 Tax=Paraburkholderia nemoris TaxID=2793076 RepID=UPI00190D96AA|nr:MULTISPECIES: heparin lyase I family protein [Paraburkholderia]MBK3786701.1 hypothetical protein [Paraburkholderia aspalathi]CAE6845066.1 hypothetical protein R75461_07209 [Paraburkholderia nemoris]
MRRIPLLFMLWYACVAGAAPATCEFDHPEGYVPVMSVDWRHGLRVLSVQAPTQQSVVIGPVVSGGGPMLNVHLSRTDDFAQIANGSPRAEVVLNDATFAIGEDYILQWSTRLRNDFQIDTAQPEIITQIHQGTPVGSPPIALLLKGNQYALEIRSNAKSVPRGVAFGAPASDRGRTICWRLHYVPDGAGENAVTELYKDGVPVYSERGSPNAYEHDMRAYLKVGIYKWLWHIEPDSVTYRAVSFGPVLLSKKKGHRRTDD